jgi:hypothetical protein
MIMLMIIYIYIIVEISEKWRQGISNGGREEEREGGICPIRYLQRKDGDLRGSVCLKP